VISPKFSPPTILTVEGAADTGRADDEETMT
jgi:hypothetical protein